MEPTLSLRIAPSTKMIDFHQMLGKSVYLYLSARTLAIAYINDLAGLLSCGAQPWAPAPNYYTWMRQMREEIQPQDQNQNWVVMETGEWTEWQQRPFNGIQ
ncbi:hypothetical protein AVEN_79929-1 [Araneus ventricosus]|uniref:Uncharacterized protein n=1 Tax=Araneus ventricosus TaxID=182803 RepID=A0A4Y2LNJ4_ARAVE|nr:hypothetical protein AVEN_79929-1 [Araneus ventricosus]